MKHLKRLDPNATAKVRYFLVCPDKGDESSSAWHMPAGWNENLTLNDHHGEVFEIRVPIAGRYGTLCIFTPSFTT
jgi:hypothetical protein